MKYDVVVIGGGAAGMMCAYTSACNGYKTALLERNDRLGRKLLITGKGRCNITNASDTDILLKNVPMNGRFLYSAFSQFTAYDTIDFFERFGVPTKTERGNRVFPESDKAIDVCNALVDAMSSVGVDVINKRAFKIVTDNSGDMPFVTGIEIEGKQLIHTEKVVVATGGLSYPKTGSTGDGYKFATSLGHTVNKPRPSLVPLIIKENCCADMMGLSLKNVTLTLLDQQKPIFSEMGELLFTHFGVSGPLVLSASAHIRQMQPQRYKLQIDLKPALDTQQLDNRILKDFTDLKNKDFANSLDKLLPRKMIPVVINRCKIDPNTKVNSITKEQRLKLGHTLKQFSLNVVDFAPIDEAIITSGGVDVKQVDPKTMQSKLVSGLFFAGEVLDLDAYTGGFNLQIAFSTGYLAGF